MMQLPCATNMDCNHQEHPNESLYTSHFSGSSGSVARCPASSFTTAEHSAFVLPTARYQNDAYIGTNTPPS